jgi:hypothetical protein
MKNLPHFRNTAGNKSYETSDRKSCVCNVTKSLIPRHDVWGAIMSELTVEERIDRLEKKAAWLERQIKKILRILGLAMGESTNE